MLIRYAAFVFFGIAPLALLPSIVRSRHLTATDFGIKPGQTVHLNTDLVAAN